MGSYFSDHSPAAYTKSKLKQMGGNTVDMGNPPGSPGGSKAESEDDYGKQKPPSDSSEFKRGGAVKKPHMGRMGRATGGRVGRAAGGKLGQNNETDNDGKKVRGGVEGRVDSEAKTDAGPIRLGDMPKYQRDERPAGAQSERANRARGGKTGKGKTVVNVVVGGGKGDQQAPPPPVMAPPMPPPQPPPQRPPMPPPQASGPPMMPPGGAPMGPAGAPPPGVPPQMRAHGGRVGNLGKYAHPPKAGFSDSKAPHRGGGKQGFSDTRPTSKRGQMEDAGAGSGEGRLEKTRKA